MIVVFNPLLSYKPGPAGNMFHSDMKPPLQFHLFNLFYFLDLHNLITVFPVNFL